jgi:hypothetical protein
VQPDAPPAAPPKARKAARLVSADAAQSTLKIAADGQLPNLQLQDDETKDKAKAKTQVVSPLVLVGAWFLSIALTVAVVVLSAGDGSGGADSPDKIRAMRDIEDKFIGDTSRGAQYAYQKALRSAQRAHARGDLKAERKHFKEVLDLLRTESRGGGGSASGRDRLEKGVTGSRDRDRELEKLIITVLGE